MPNSIPQKILIIRMSSIGDVILTTPVIRQLRGLYPASQIDFLIRREFAAVLRANPHLSNLIEIDVREKGALAAMKSRIRKTGYDVILDLHGNFRSLWLRSGVGAARIYKIKKNKWLRHLLVNYKINLYEKKYGKALSVAEKYLRAAAPLGVDVSDTRPELHLPDDNHREKSEKWRQWRKKEFQVVMAPGARHFTKRWLPEYYAELIRMLRERHGWRTLLVGGPDERETCTQIQQAAGMEIAENLAGELSLLQTFALIAGAPLFVSNDSGLMHAAAAFGIPQIAIFGSTTRELGFFPVNPNATVVENSTLDCRPCTHIGRSACPKGHFRCMREVTPEMLYDALQSLSNTHAKA